MPQNNDQLLKEIYRLTRENNEMMHRSRRSSFFWGFVKLLIYLVFLGAVFWFYSTFMAPLLNEALQTMNKIQGANSQAQTQFQGLQSALNQIQQLESRFGISTTTNR